MVVPLELKKKGGLEPFGVLISPKESNAMKMNSTAGIALPPAGLGLWVKKSPRRFRSFLSEKGCREDPRNSRAHTRRALGCPRGIGCALVRLAAARLVAAAKVPSDTS